MLLSPGAYFPLSLLVSMTAGAILTTPEIADYNGAYLGPDLALSIQAAMSEGDIWKTIAIIMPIYGFCGIGRRFGAGFERSSRPRIGRSEPVCGPFFM